MSLMQQQYSLLFMSNFEQGKTNCVTSLYILKSKLSQNLNSTCVISKYMFTHIEEMVSTYAVKVILDPQGK